MDRYLITGATGYVGSMFLKELTKEGGKITAIVRNREKAERMLDSKVDIIVGDILDTDFIQRIDRDFDYIVHFAAITKSSEMVSRPVEIIDGIVNGTRNILEIARRNRLKSMVYVSSMEIYGNIDCFDGHRVKEDELGDLDYFSERSCYPIGKRTAEHLCYLYSKEFGVPVKIARLSQTFGKGVLPGENRVFAQFAKAAVEGSDIVLHTKGLSMGNYCDISDVIAGLKILLDKGNNGEAYNIVNEDNTMGIREMAKLVAHDIVNDRIKVVYDIDKSNIKGYAADTGIRLSGEKMKKLGFEPTVSLKDMYLQMMEEMK